MAKSGEKRPASRNEQGTVFVSYARVDKARVRTIVEYLESRSVSIWWDECIEAGERWRRVISNRLAGASCVVVVWTEASIDRSFVSAEVQAALDGAAGSGRLVPVLLDEAARKRIPLPFGEFQSIDLTEWDGESRGPLSPLAKRVAKLSKRHRRDGEGSQNLQDDWGLSSANSASTELRRLTRRVGSIGEVLIADDGPARELRVALTEVHRTLDVVHDAVSEFVLAGIDGEQIDVAPFVRFERGSLTSRIARGRGHCEQIAIHYGRHDGIREWLTEHAKGGVVKRADAVFGALSEADDDLFRGLAFLGDLLTNESRVVVNLVVGGQHDLARKRILDGRRRLAPVEAGIAKSMEVLEEVERRLGFAI